MGISGNLQLSSIVEEERRKPRYTSTSQKLPPDIGVQNKVSQQGPQLIFNIDMKLGHVQCSA